MTPVAPDVGDGGAREPAATAKVATVAKVAKVAKVALVLFGLGLAGVLFGIAVLFAERAAGGVDVAALAIAIAGALVIVPHVGVSWLRAWRGGHRRALVVSAGLAACVAALVIVAVAVTNRGDDVMDALWTVALLVMPMHIALQAHRTGIVVAMRSSSTSRTSVARGPHGAASVLLALTGVAAVLTGPRAPLIIRGAWSLETGRALVVSLALGAVVIALVSRAASGADGQRAASVRVGVLFASFALLWTLPLFVDGAYDPRLLVGGPLALAHGGQMLWTAFVAEPRLARLRGATFDPIAHLAAALVVGALVLVDVPWIAARALSLDVVTLLLAVQAAFAVQHALVDVVAWGVREPLLCRALTDPSIAPADHGRASVSNARALAFAIPGFLVVSGLAVDVLENWLTRTGANPHDLAFASVLAPDDSRASLATAAASIGANDDDGARTALGGLLLAHAYAPEAARIKLALCIARATERARPSCLDGIPASMGDDVVMLATRSSLALHAGEVALARTLADRALALAEEQHNDVALADALAAAGAVDVVTDSAAARGRIERALALRTAEISGDPFANDAMFVDAGLALVALDAKAAPLSQNKKDEIDDVTARVLRFAEARDRADVALRVHIAKARALDAMNEPHPALAEYKRALRLARFVDEPTDEARAWLEYENLLDRSQAPSDAVLACALEAEASAHDVVDEARKRELLAATEAAVKAASQSAGSDVVARVTAAVETYADAALALEYGTP